MIGSREAFEVAKIYNVRQVLENNWDLTDDLRPAIRTLVVQIKQVAMERGLTWQEVFEEMVDINSIKEHEEMGEN